VKTEDYDKETPIDRSASGVLAQAGKFLSDQGAFVMGEAGDMKGKVISAIAGDPLNVIEEEEVPL